MLLKEPDDTWDLPGWGWDNGESLEAAIRREIQEEIGVNVVTMSLTPSMVWTVRSAKGFYRLILVFEVTVDTFDVKVSGWYEALAMEFFSKEDIETEVAKLHPICEWLKNFL